LLTSASSVSSSSWCQLVLLLLLLLQRLWHCWQDFPQPTFFHGCSVLALLLLLLLSADHAFTALIEVNLASHCLATVDPAPRPQRFVFAGFS
jgi:hypothetical protein